MVFRGGGAFLHLVIIAVSGEDTYSHTADNAGVAVVVGISIVVIAGGGRVYRNSEVLVLEESRPRQIRVRQRTKQGAEIIRGIPGSSEVILHVLVEQSTLRSGHCPVLPVIPEVSNRLKGNFVFAFGDVLVG